VINYSTNINEQGGVCSEGFSPHLVIRVVKNRTVNYDTN